MQKAPSDRREQWERALARFLKGAGVPYFKWDALHKRFVGVGGHSFARIMPRKEGGWKNVPWQFRRLETTRNLGNPHPLIVFITQPDNGEFVGDSYVLMRLSTYAPMLATLIENDPGRYLGKE